MRRVSLSGLFVLLLLLFAAGLSTLHGQAVESDAAGQFSIKANARTVLVDVVVTGKKGQPVRGLHKEDFEAAEDGRPQAIAYFEEHTGETRPGQVAPPALPPNVFTNIPHVPATDALTILLLDSLNTPLEDQTRVHKEAYKYLQELEPGHRIAIFTLGSRLRYVQGFTDDPSLLKEALASATRGGQPQASLLLQSSTEQTAEATANKNVEGYGAAGASAAAGLRNFAQELAISRNDMRVGWTFQALQQLAQYLGGIPGRKNVAWFSGAFPIVLFPKVGVNTPETSGRDFGAQVREVDAALVAAHVAIYPIAAEGLANDSLYDAGTQLVGVHSAKEVQDASNTLRQDEAMQRNGEHATMDQIASDTGGAAVYNSNGLKDALARVVDHGSYYYTLYYTPTNPADDGHFRKIRVKLVNDKYTLAYRRGYYAADAKKATADAKKAALVAPKPVADPLSLSMGPGVPESTQIPIALRVKPPAAGKDDVPAPAPGKPMPGHYAVDFVVAVKGLQLNPTDNGGRQGKIEAMLLVYDQEGHALNAMIRQVDLTMDAARYAWVQANGINFRMEIDAPKGAASLRGGVYDWGSKMSGTLEVTMDRVVGGTQTASAGK